MTRTINRIAILGAGPIGLEAALAAAERGLDFTVHEAAPRVGGYVRRWGHVRLFTPWSMDVSERMARALDRAGASRPSGDDLPTGHAFIDRLLEPVAAVPELAGRLHLGTRVLAVGREGLTRRSAPRSVRGDPSGCSCARRTAARSWKTPRR